MRTKDENGGNGFVPIVNCSDYTQYQSDRFEAVSIVCYRVVRDIHLLPGRGGMILGGVKHAVIMG